jgi:enoyl-CoA hydratase/carnithine racemase
VWRAEGKVFSAGADGNAFQRVVAVGPERADEITRPLMEAVQGFEEVRTPTVMSRPSATSNVAWGSGPGSARPSPGQTWCRRPGSRHCS